MEMEINRSMTQSKYLELDPEAFNRYFGGIERKMAVGIYVKTAHIFLKNIETRMTTLTDALNNYDNQSAIVNSHQVKGSLLSLGGNSLAEIFRKIEMSVNLLPNDELLKELQAVRSKLDLFISELKMWITELEASV